VHITYDVEVGEAVELKELPFVVGYSISRYAGGQLPALKIAIDKVDPQTTDQVWAMKPRHLPRRQQTHQRRL
jgi:hypothetical protein